MAYYTLIASLPHLPPHFDVERPPISFPRLGERLKLLSEDDLRTLRQLLNFLSWDRQSLDRTDLEIVREYERLQREIHNPLVLKIINFRMDLRTIVSGLRRRRAGLEPPAGVGQYVRQLEWYWKAPFFNLERRLPWIEEFARLLDEGDAVAAERLLFEVSWRTWSRMAQDYTFSFEAVLLYVARWAIVDRWTSRSLERGLQRFDKLIEETLGEYASLQF